MSAIFAALALKRVDPSMSTKTNDTRTHVGEGTAGKCVASRSVSTAAGLFRRTGDVGCSALVVVGFRAETSRRARLLQLARELFVVARVIVRTADRAVRAAADALAFDEHDNVS
jgi:hypothetical protein